MNNLIFIVTMLSSPQVIGHGVNPTILVECSPNGKLVRGPSLSSRLPVIRTAFEMIFD